MATSSLPMQPVLADGHLFKECGWSWAVMIILKNLVRLPTKNVESWLITTSIVITTTYQSWVNAQTYKTLEILVSRMTDISKWQETIRRRCLPTHVVPFPVYPAKHWQANDPTSSMHRALASQLCWFVEHSSTSAGNRKYETQKVTSCCTVVMVIETD